MNIRKIVSAFAVGVTILAFTYLAVYVLGGLDAYLEEIKLLVKPRLLAKEVLWSGIVCVSFTYLTEAFKAMRENKDNKVAIVIGVGLAFLAVVIYLTAKINKIYKSETIEDIFYTTLLVYYLADIGITMIGFKMEEKKLNQKIKERNS